MSDPNNPLSSLLERINATPNGGGDGGGDQDDSKQTGGGDSSRPNKVTWQPDEAAEDYDVRLSDGSIRPMSESALRSMVIELRKANLIDARHALQLLDIPDWEEIAEALEKEMQLAALAKLQRK
jgi:hypothetical protein